jgi:PBP1b-binding outer membrane lipoprotein LpoB
MKRLLLCSVLLMALTGCGDRYRYACQDPANANTTQCQCEQELRTKNKALGAIESGVTTTTIRQLKGFDC